VYWPLVLRPLLEHLLDCLLHHFLIFVAIVVQGVLGDAAPDQLLIAEIARVDPGPGQDLVGGGRCPPRVGGGECGEDVNEVLLSIAVEAA